MGKFIRLLTDYSGNLLQRFHLKSSELLEHSVRLTPKRFLGIKYANNIKYGSKKVGFVNYEIKTKHYATEADFPTDWFVKEAPRDKGGNHLLKPFMWINELRMNDRFGKPYLVKRDKKYGAMTMKELLKIAQNEGCDSRIALLADVLPDTGFKPGRFYNKMGFSLTPAEQYSMQKAEDRYLDMFEELKIKGLSEEEIEELLGFNGIFKPEKIGGRFVAETGRFNLTNPECIIDYLV